MEYPPYKWVFFFTLLNKQSGKRLPLHPGTGWLGACDSVEPFQIAEEIVLQVFVEGSGDGAGLLQLLPVQVIQHRAVLDRDFFVANFPAEIGEQFDLCWRGGHIAD